MTEAGPQTVRVVALHIAPARGAPLTAVDRIDVEAGSGVVGDRYYGSTHRHISVQSATSLASAAAALGRPLGPESTRRTVTVSHGDIPTVPGSRMRLGDVQVEVVRIAAPCRVMDQINGPGARRALHGRGGSVCRVLTSGSISLDDAAWTADTTG
ncbi:MAG: MOSC domain-containing protein [Ornithinimicrobium sp.]